MNKTETLQRAHTVCRTRRLSRHTEASYCGWLERFLPFVQRHRDLPREERIRLYLEHLAPRTSAATQNQALNAIVFLYRDVLNQPLGELGKWARAKRPKRLPTCLTVAEMDRLLSVMSGGAKLMARFAFGTGLRLAELLALRIKDIDLEARLVTVHGGKGDKDRVTCLPESLVLDLQTHLMRVRAIYDADRASGAAPIYLPDGLERKFKNGGTEWPWFWLWPANSESTDPRTRIIRRHHVHEDTLGKALKTATRRCGLSKRVTVHTLRHSFATALISNGASINQVQELLGHSSVETTMVYLHCVPQFAQSVTSPLDTLAAAKIIAFETPQPMRRIS